ncbi:MAG: GspE/PulE family protein [Candidatus Nealsonbacteria bacterium]|nr:GspE/PulE family protein [Candidatus Nealsonbacteria bacterium]
MENDSSTINITSQGKNVKNISEFQEKTKASLNKNVSDLLAILFGGAIDLNASDFHIEPEEKGARIRLRIDGILQDALLIDKALYENILSRIKLLSKTKLNVTDRPQDGRFSILAPPKTLIEIRTSILPAEKGESIVLRILNPKSLIKLEGLGLRKDLFELFQEEIKRPNGMIIVTGPTGSGKTTTLYAFLKSIQRPEIKIITIEDPIEYHLKGISQTQTKKEKGYDFASGLKSLMRQDPDVILVGEVRDLETVETALQAALTGHLVLTTLHTNDAAGTIARLVSLGANPSNIGPAVNLAVAQRLIRKTCEKCGTLKSPSPEELQKLKKELKNIPKNIKIRQAKGCSQCNLTGYKGRIGVFEAFLIDDEMEKFILTSPSIAALREKAVERGMISIKKDGFMKVLEGITTIEEVERVVGKK